MTHSETTGTGRAERRWPFVVAVVTGATVAAVSAALVVATAKPGGTHGVSAAAVQATLPAAAPDDAPPASSRIRLDGVPPVAPGRIYHIRPEPPAPLLTPVPAAPGLPAPGVDTGHAVVIDGNTGAMIWGRNEHQPVATASTIKILTALTALRFTTPDDVVPVDQEAVDVGEREINLQPGEQDPAGNLLGAMLVGSANDAATALAKYVGGSVPGWANDANWLAARLGTENTHVMNPHGLDQPGHAASAYDLAILERVGLDDPTFAHWTSQQTYGLPIPGATVTREAVNRNRLLREYAGTIGGKTGGTDNAGSCLVGAARRGDQFFIVASMHSNIGATEDDKAMLDWAFANYETVTVGHAGETVTTSDGLHARLNRDLSVTVPKSLAPAVATRVRNGAVEAFVPGEVLSSSPVEA